MSRDWRIWLPEDERQIYEQAGYGASQVWGQRPALVVVDLTVGFAGREELSDEENAKCYPNFCRGARPAVKATIELAELARSLNVSVFLSGLPEDPHRQVGRWRQKHPNSLEAPPDHRQFAAGLYHPGTDTVIHKAKPSAFFGTPLLPMLIDERVDTVLVTGCTTSGCVRATVVDSFSLGFATFVCEDAVFDRAITSHMVNLYEMQAKYADVLTRTDAEAHIRRMGGPDDLQEIGTEAQAR